ncbi:CHAT domain-containing protein [Winogradskyella ouciana]|uniref:CHAT domain-containing protein n=1 Tax=Winogradskyella ouciana TaxID=2608631 RepID=A0A7K1GIV6_9FLAO|nr:CHAT domain-containing protein [Winogradskyella ouciana]MTE28249.1 CHAT domain-containing protein [Winogradskyella ouciana]
MKLFLLSLVAFFAFNLASFGQEDELLTNEIKDIIKKHEENIRALYNVRGAPQDWIETDNFDDRLLKSVLDKYLYKNVGILVYTYYDNSLKLSLFSKGYGNVAYAESKVVIDSVTLQNHVTNTNLLFSSNFLNRAPKLRGAKAKTVSDTNLEDSFTELNKILLPPELGLGNFNHLIIVPTFNIATLPFSAFKVKERYSDEESYLIEKMSYSIAPNLFELMLSSDRNTTKFNERINEVTYKWENALFVANPKYPDNLDWEFPDLPGAEEEVDYIIKNSNPTLFKQLNSKEATKENTLENICEYDLLYFATHGISNSEQPMDHSFLVLADNKTDKSYLSLREIMNIRHTCKLQADLVVLSACQTGLGKSHKGGIIGLARAFQIAGAQHVLMSLWNISDSETATLMKFFFNELEIAKELMPHEALRNAILKYKNEVNDDPKYWAAFSIFGVPY